MLACLPMYDLPELAAETDAWWQGLARALRREGVTGVPQRLSRPQDPDPLLSDPALLLGQTCGYPMTHGLAGKVRYLASPCYRAPGCSGSDYRSFLLVQEEETARDLAALRGRRLAVNAPDSHSGMNVLRAMLAPLAGGGPFFSEVVMSGSHRASMERVRSGQSDLAAVDCVSYALLAAVAPEAVEGLRILAHSPPAPSLPYVTAAAASSDLRARLWAGLARAAEDPELADVRARLLIEGVERRDPADYDVIPAMATAAAEAGYPELR